MTTNIWNRLSGGGYVTDAMLETGSNNAVVPVCGSSAPAPNTGRATGQTRGNNAGAAGYCTWGAYQKWFEASGRRHYPALVGNATDWDNSARQSGWTVVLDAQPRSIVVFEASLVGGVGHVAWVDRVENRPDGRYISITEMNYGPGGTAANGYKTTGFNKWNTRVIKDVPGMSYILLP
ncbi:CHAP domain-containing protein [Prescottella equi]